MTIDHSSFQVCEQCQNVKYEREGYFITVDIEKGMQDGQVEIAFVLRFGLDGCAHVKQIKC